MSNKAIIIFILSLCFSVKISAQKCPPAYYKGTLFTISENESMNLCFKWEPVPESDPDVYHTKYTINSGNGKEMYNIHFYFYQSLDSIALLYLNTATGKTATKAVTFSEHNSIRMIKNYKINDTEITEKTQFCTLFTIPDLSRPYIVLNQFQLLDDKDSYLSLDPINPEKLQQHLSEVMIYKKWKDSMNIINEKDNERMAYRRNEISSFLNSMKAYKEKTIQKIIDEDNDLKINGAALEASTGLLDDFKSKLDPLFIDYYKKIFPFENFNSEMKFTFICNADGIIEDSRANIQPGSSLQIRWFEDSFNVNVAPYIRAAVYKTVTTTRYNPNLITDFNAKFNESFSWLKPDNNEFKEFLDTKKRIYGELDKYLSREINVPVKYTYVIKYKSTVEITDWIYEISRKGVEKIGPKGSVLPVSDSLINIFKNKIAKPDIGKYHIKICTVYINDVLMGQDIQLI